MHTPILRSVSVSAAPSMRCESLSSTASALLPCLLMSPVCGVQRSYRTMRVMHGSRGELGAIQRGTTLAGLC